MNDKLQSAIRAKEQTKCELGKFQNCPRGFTIVELLVVLGVVSMLMVGSIFAVGSTRKASRDVLRVAHMKELYFGLEIYFNEFGNYPPGAGVVLGSPIAKCLDKTGFHPQGQCVGEIFMTTILANPIPGGSPFVYSYVDGPPPQYSVDFALETNSAGLVLGPHMMTPSGIR